MVCQRVNSFICAVIFVTYLGGCRPKTNESNIKNLNSELEGLVQMEQDFQVLRKKDGQNSPAQATIDFGTKLAQNYEESKRPMEAAWTWQSIGNISRRNLLLDALSKELTQGEIVEIKPLKKGNTETRIVTLKNDLIAVFKVDEKTNFHDNPDSELCAFEVDRMLELGIVPLTVSRTIDGTPGGMQYFIKNATNALGYNHLAVLLDNLTQNGDRSSGHNQLNRLGGSFVAIDNGAGFVFPFPTIPDFNRALGVAAAQTLPPNVIAAIRRTTQSDWDRNLQPILERFSIQIEQESLEKSRIPLNERNKILAQKLKNKDELNLRYKLFLARFNSLKKYVEN